MSNQQIQQPIDYTQPLDNGKHEEFAWRYALCGNATEAYTQVYETSRDTASTAGSRLLGNVEIRARVDFIQKAQTDTAFATLTKNFNAKKIIVHDADAVLTEVEDPQAQIAAATAILKANGRMITASAQLNIDQSTNYTMLNMTQVDGIERVADKLLEMNQKLLERRAKTPKIIDVQAE